MLRIMTLDLPCLNLPHGPPHPPCPPQHAPSITPSIHMALQLASQLSFQRFSKQGMIMSASITCSGKISAASRYASRFQRQQVTACATTTKTSIQIPCSRSGWTEASQPSDLTCQVMMHVSDRAAITLTLQYSYSEYWCV